jgi:hypothetical protein
LAREVPIGANPCILWRSSRHCSTDWFSSVFVDPINAWVYSSAELFALPLLLTEQRFDLCLRDAGAQEANGTQVKDREQHHTSKLFSFAFPAIDATISDIRSYGGLVHLSFSATCIYGKNLNMKKTSRSRKNTHKGL